MVVVGLRVVVVGLRVVVVDLRVVVVVGLGVVVVEVCGVDVTKTPSSSTNERRARKPR